MYRGGPQILGLCEEFCSTYTEQMIAIEKTLKRIWNDLESVRAKVQDSNFLRFPVSPKQSLRTKSPQVMQKRCYKLTDKLYKEYKLLIILQ